MRGHVSFILAHPDLGASRANRALAQAAAGVENVTVHDLYRTYPDLFVDGAAERRRLADASAIVLQFPLYWYSAPGLLKEWIDRTLTAGWAYGRGGERLKGLPLLISVSTGSGPEAYAPDGVHARPITDYFAPFEQIARFCGMLWQDPLVFHHARQAEKARLNQHIETLRTRLADLAGKTG